MSLPVTVLTYIPRLTDKNCCVSLFKFYFVTFPRLFCLIGLKWHSCFSFSICYYSGISLLQDILIAYRTVTMLMQIMPHCEVASIEEGVEGTESWTLVSRERVLLWQVTYAKRKVNIVVIVFILPFLDWCNVSFLLTL